MPLPIRLPARAHAPRAATSRARGVLANPQVVLVDSRAGDAAGWESDLDLEMRGAPV